MQFVSSGCMLQDPRKRRRKKERQRTNGRQQHRIWGEWGIFYFFNLVAHANDDCPMSLNLIDRHKNIGESLENINNLDKFVFNGF